MPQIEISPEVAGHIGPEQIQRFRTEPSLWIGECWECQQRVNADTDLLALLLLQVPEDVMGPGEMMIARLAHARCAASGIHLLDPAEPRARAELAALRPGGEDAIAIAAMWQTPAALGMDPRLVQRHPELVPQPRATLFLSLKEIAGWSETGDRVNLLMSEVFLPGGWEMAGNVHRTPAAVPPGWSIQYQLGGPDTTGPGVLTVFRPGPSEYAVFEDWSTPPLWTAAVYNAGEVTVLAGALGMNAWAYTGPDIKALQRAARDGHVAGARLPVTLRDRKGRLMASPPR